MQFIIEVIQSATSAPIPTKTGSYRKCELTYKRVDNGKIEAKKLMSFTEPTVFETASKATAGTQFTVTAEKGDQYWEWKKLEASTGVSAPSQSGKVPVAASRSTYETPEERAKKQVYIIKQSSISAAVALLCTGAKTPPSTELVLAEAQKLVDWVMFDGIKLGVDMDDFGQHSDLD